MQRRAARFRLGETMRSSSKRAVMWAVGIFAFITLLATVSFMATGGLGSTGTDPALREDLAGSAAVPMGSGRAALPAAADARPAPTMADAPDPTPVEVEVAVIPGTGDDGARGVPLWQGRQGAASFSAQANLILSRSASFAESNRNTTARQLAAADDPSLQALGALMRFRDDGHHLSADLIDRLLSSGEPAAALMVLGWMQDNGFGASAQELLTAWRGKGWDATVIADRLAGGGLEPGAARVAISLVASALPREEARDVLERVAREPNQRPAVRLAAALYLRDTMPFDDYQQAVESISRGAAKTAIPPSQASGRGLAASPAGNRPASGVTRVWQAAIGRLASQVSGPSDLVAGPVSLTSADVEVLFENRNSATLELAAAQLEYVLSHPDSLVGAGVSQRVRDYLGPIREEGVSEDDVLCLQRIETCLTRLPAREHVALSRGEALY